MIAVKSSTYLLNYIAAKSFVEIMISEDLLSKPFPESDVDNFSFKFAGNRSYSPSEKCRPIASKSHDEFRKPVDQRLLSITPDLIEWLRILPAKVRPKNLILEFPRVANTLARYAPYPKVLERLLSEYMLDERGGRKGFPFDVLQEMANLREYYSATERGT